jgi:hypothetical protein
MNGITILVMETPETCWLHLPCKNTSEDAIPEPGREMEPDMECIGALGSGPPEL